MFALVGWLSVVGGAAMASLSDRFAAHVEALETGAGLLLIGGLALVGCGLPVIL